ncbi:hypothetical protein OB2597_00905 [Pseudooceanicola batsensis HTCC2597]|uniref:Cadherin domain-containing protein n=1 Tax=Pseudooceanicola batsensis (strain ATCC BAA-863 / DSM 15984 / KCTC 12145 / HTCC2597) TaxID=252305 RepID=A3U1Z8_PSEBH|nr:SdrD B-like domain-containing protein [Pseudooceanicola batsensis]EAQ01932.1 hypothetical protein OB2597_00905 [Pseudooceanicola batsensis HTCC2597]
MTYYYSKYSYYNKHSYSEKKYEWTAYTEADLLGDHNGKSIDCGDTFPMPGSATVCMSTYDNDGYLSGDSSWWSDDKATDSTGQKAYIDGGREGGQLYAEQYHVLKGSDGKYYYLIEIEVEGYDAPGKGDDYFTFYGKVPPAGVELEVVSTKNVWGCMIDYRCLGAGDKAPENTPPEFTNDPKYGKICIDENSTFVIDLNAKDDDGDTLTYEIVGGEDADKFEIDAETGELRFKDAPDYENPTDKGEDNVYEVKVKVSDGNGGEDTTKLKVCVEDVEEQTGKCIVIEAEDMCEWGFSKAWGCDASGGKLVKLNCAGGQGKLWTTFDGPSGTYDFKIYAQDENDGQSKLKIYINGEFKGYIKLDRDSDGSGSNHGTFSTFVLEDIEINKGDTIKIYADGDCNEYVRIDKIELCKDDKPLGAIGDTVWYDTDRDGVQDDGEAGVENVTVNLLNGAGVVIATQMTDVNGNYLFEELEAGDYKVEFELPDGNFVFTTQDAGSDDAVDSDADTTTGLTDTIALGEGETNLTVDAGLYDPNDHPEPTDDAAKTCADEEKTVDVLANDSDPNGDTLTITHVDGQAITEGGEVTTSAGTLVKLLGGMLVVDGEDAYEDLDIAEHAMEDISYTVSDGMGGSATANLEMTFCGDANTVESFVGYMPETVSYKVADGLRNDPYEDVGYDILITESDNGRLDGVEFTAAYCLDFNRSITTGADYDSAAELDGDMFVFNDDTASSVLLASQNGVNGAALDNVNEINWILNQDFESDGTGSVDGKFSGWEVQYAIWELTNNFPSDAALNATPSNGQVEDVDYIVSRAISEGYDFEAGVGDIIGLVITPDPVTAQNAQPFLVGVEFETYDCLC